MKHKVKKVTSGVYRFRDFIIWNCDTFWSVSWDGKFAPPSTHPMSEEFKTKREAMDFINHCCASA